MKLIFGKDENYYKEKLKEDIREFLAPWAVGDFYKIAFGQCVNRSDIIRFLESLDYIDFIIELSMRHESEKSFPLVNGVRVQQNQVCPKTPRSILIAGDIDVCIDPKACEQWDKCKIIDVTTGKEIEIDCCDQKEEIIQYCNPNPVVIVNNNG